MDAFANENARAAAEMRTAVEKLYTLLGTEASRIGPSLDSVFKEDDVAEEIIQREFLTIYRAVNALKARCWPGRRLACGSGPAGAERYAVILQVTAEATCKWPMHPQRKGYSRWCHCHHKHTVYISWQLIIMVG